jgi:methionine-rich copper-binding protein CopC
MNKEFFKTKSARVLIWVAVIIAVALFLWLTAPKSPSKTQPATNVNNALLPATNTNVGVNANINKPKATTPAKNPVAPKIAGYVEKRAPHFVSANIANNATLTQAPDHLTITFDAPIIKNAQAVLTVKKNDVTSVTMNSSSINDKTMTVRLNTQVTDGDYSVYYAACFTDVGCKDGRFGYHLKLP